MNHSMINSMVSMNGIQQKLDILANNMANINTTGYKRKEASFEDILTNIKQQPQGFQREGRLSPLGFNQGWGSKLSQVQIQFSQGTLNTTGADTDLAIEGDGLFELESVTLDANGNQVKATLYSRDGGFQMTTMPGIKDRVFLTNNDGHFVLDDAGNRISVPNGFKIAVDENGKVTAYDPSKPEEPAIPIAQLQIVRALRPQFLQPVGDNLYSIPASLAANRKDILQPVGGNNSQLEQPIKVRQGFLEQSNVNLSDEMSELMMVQRAFQLNSRALSSSDQMMNLANNLRA